MFGAPFRLAMGLVVALLAAAPVMAQATSQPARKLVDTSASEDPGDAADGEAGEPTDVETPATPSAPTQDGDLSQDGIAPHALLRDGIVEDGLSNEVRDQGSEADTRPPEDAELFALPGDRRDALLFQIEDIDPIITDRRPQRLARLEPYDPVGVRLGSFVLFPEAESNALWTSNVFKSQDKKADYGAEFKPSARLVSDWAAHAVELRGTGTFSYLDEYKTEENSGYLAEARGRLDVTRRSNVQAVVSRELAQESRSAIDASQVGDRTDITTDRAEVAFNQRFNRLRVQLRGAIADVDYAATRTSSGIVDNSDRDVQVTQEAVRAGWEFKPTLTAFVETAVNQRDYGVAASDGLRRSSKGERYRAGVDFGGTSQILRGQVSVGWGEQSAEAASLGSASGWLFDANLVWRPTELTSLTLTAQSEIDDTISPGAAFAFSRSAGVEVRHALQRDLVATAGVAYLNRQVEGAPISEDQWTTSLGLDYFLSREVILFGRYDHTAFSSTTLNGDWAADEVRVGVRVRR